MDQQPAILCAGQCGVLALLRQIVPPHKMGQNGNVTPVLKSSHRMLMWSDKKADTIVYTERGEVCCICSETGTEHDLAFHGFEAQWATVSTAVP